MLIINEQQCLSFKTGPHRVFGLSKCLRILTSPIFYAIRVASIVEKTNAFTFNFSIYTRIYASMMLSFNHAVESDASDTFFMHVLHTSMKYMHDKWMNYYLSAYDI